MKTGLLVFVLLSFFGIASAQIPGEPTSVQSPNAASLGMYGEVPVSLYTGLPSIQIPLYTAQEGRIEVPITLSYHASGFRPDVHPGWVGTGWNLAAGGTIRRTVHDLPDEYSNSNYFRLPNGPTAGYYFSSGGLNRPDWSDTTFMKQVAQTNLATDYDTEPDEFAFDFGGYSGKFYLDATKNWKVKCDKPLKITPFVPSQTSAFLDVPFTLIGSYQLTYGRSQTFVGFTVTTEDGTQYIFGGATSAIEYEIGMFVQDRDEWRANAWHLTQIIHNDGHHVEFTYERDVNQFVAQMYNNMFSNLYTRAVTPNSPPAPLVFIFPLSALLPAGIFGDNVCSGTDINEVYDWQYSGKLVAPVYLASIQTSSSTIFFDRATSNERTYDPKVFDYQFGRNEAGFVFLESFPPYYPNDLAVKFQWKKLTAIRVVSKTTTNPIKSFIFSYNENAPTERLTLLQVFEQGGIGQKGSNKPPYRFGYNKYHNLPGYLSNKTDHWGFYNAQVPVTDYTNNFSAYYSYREASTDSAVYLAGMLTRIIYPTGGVTDFQYEQHAFGKQLSENRFLPPQVTASSQPAGGVRIKKITSYSLDNPSQKVSKEYLYVSGYTPTNSTNLPSSGILGGRVRYVFYDYRAKAFNLANTVYSRSIFSSQSVLPACSNSRGSHIGYSTIVEKRNDGSYTQYTYSNFDSNLDEFPLNVLQPKTHSRTLYSPYTSTEEERGNLLREDLFTNTGLPVKQKITDYVALNKSSEYVPALAAFSFPVCSHPGGPVGSPPDTNPVLSDEATAYKFYTYSCLPVRQTETIFDRNGTNGLTTITTTDYNADKLPTRVATTSSKGETLVTTYSYPWDTKYNYTTKLTDPVARTLYNMRGGHILKYPLETVVSKNGNVVAATVQTFNQGGAFGSGTRFFQTFQLEPTTAIPVATYTGLNVNTGTQANGNDNPPAITPPLKLTFAGYDLLGNVLDAQKVGGQRSCYLWDYNKSLLVAKVDNAAPNQVAYTGFEADGPGIGPAYVNNTVQPAGPFDWSYDPRLGQTTNGKPVHLQRNGGVTGNGSYILDGNWGVGRANLAPGDYEFTLWLQGGASGVQVFLDNTSQLLSQVDEYTNSQGYHLLHYRLRVTQGSTANPTGSVSIDAYGRLVAVDDVRLYPVGAQMTTQTYAPLVGLTSSSDVNSRPLFYEYDALNRLLLVRDQDGNVVKQYQYNYKNQ